MGTEKTSTQPSHRIRPPPVPPRPQHLIPVKAMSKYSSMPDILNGWKRDTNPDLLKLGNAAYTKRGVVDVVEHVNGGGGYPPMYAASNEYIADKKLVSNYGDAKNKGNNYAMLPVRDRGGVHMEGDKNAKYNKVSSRNGIGGHSHQQYVNEKSSKKFSCIPSRSNSKKKQKNMLQGSDDINGNCRYSGKGNHGQISQTSWYVEDIVGKTTVQLSKCEISVNNAAADRSTAATATNYRYVTSPPPPPSSSSSENVSMVAVDSCVFSNRSNNIGTNDNVNKNKISHSQQRVYREHYQQPQAQPQPQSPQRRRLAKPQPAMMSSSSLSSLPALPQSLSDASLLWETTNKKLSACPVSLSPARSSSSSSSRSSSIVHPRVPPPAVPRSNSVSWDDQNKFSAVYVNSAVVGATTNGNDVAGKEERPRPPRPPRKPTSLDMKLSILKKDMHVLRQMDLSLLSRLRSLNESIHELRQKQELLSPNSAFVNSSDEEDSGCYHSNISSQGMVTPNHHNTLGSSSSRSGISTSRSTSHKK